MNGLVQELVYIRAEARAATSEESASGRIVAGTLSAMLDGATIQIPAGACDSDVVMSISEIQNLPSFAASGVAPGPSELAPLVREVHQQNAIRHHDAHHHQCADHRLVHPPLANRNPADRVPVTPPATSIPARLSSPRSP